MKTAIYIFALALLFWFAPRARAQINNPSNYANCNTLETAIYCVDSTNSQGWSPGSDIGAWINDAYAAIPSRGGQIWVFCGNTQINYSTPIVLGTSGKFVSLVGMSGTAQNCQLNYTPTTATIAITYDVVPVGGSAESPGVSISNIELVNNACNTQGGCGSSATGVQWGGTNIGGHALEANNLGIRGFNFGYTINSVNTWGMTCRNCTIASNATGLQANAAAENTAFIGGRFAGNGTAVSWTGGGDLSLDNMSIDQSTTTGVNVTNGSVHILFPHFENQAVGTATTTHFVVTSSTGFAEIVGGTATDDVASGTGDWFFQSGGYGIYVSGLFYASVGRTEPGILNNISTSRGYFCGFSQSSGFVTATVTGASASAVSSCPFNASNGNPALPWVIEAGINPSTTAGASLGTTTGNLPWNNMVARNLVLVGTSSGQRTFTPTSTGSSDTYTLPDVTGTLAIMIVNGTSAMTTAAIATGACGTTVTTAATGALTTDAIEFSRNAAATIGNGGGLTLNSWPTAGNVNFNYCNSAAGTITPTAMTVNWRVVR